MVTCKHDTVVQVRGQMGEGDYFDVLKNDEMESFLSRVPRDYHSHVHLDDENRTDLRIICRKCHLTTGWNKADAPGMPGVGLDFAKRKWDAMIRKDG